MGLKEDWLAKPGDSVSQRVCLSKYDSLADPTREMFFSKGIKAEEYKNKDWLTLMSLKGLTGWLIQENSVFPKGISLRI